MSTRDARNNPTPHKRPSVKDQRAGRTRRAGNAGGPATQTGERRVPASNRRTKQPLAPRRAPANGGALGTASGGSIGGRNPLAIGIIAVVAIAAIIAVSLAARGCHSDAGKETVTEEPVEQEPAFTPNPGPYSISFASTGDIIFGREVGTYVDMYGGASALANVADELAAADITIANVEAPLSDDESEPIPEKDVYLISRPAGIESLVESDVTFASLANNHSMDYGAPALADTLDALDEAGILHAGAGLTEDEAGELSETIVDGVSVAFLSWTDIIPNNFLAFGDNAGVVTARLNMDDACRRVREAKETHDIVIVAMHWGIEYEDYITKSLQSAPAHQLVDAGADVIIGNHPHVIQGIEFYHGSLISYSQGDFVFDHYSEKTGETFILNFDITENGIGNVTATPVYLDDIYGIPSIVTGDHAETILGRLEEISAGMNSAFEISGDVAHISERV